MTDAQIAKLIAGYISPAIPGTPDATEWAKWVRYCAEGT